MKRIFLLLIGIFFSQLLCAQGFKITGKVVASENQMPLEGADVYVKTSQNKGPLVFGISDSKGYFELEGETLQEELTLYISFNGYQTLVFELVPQALIAMGTIRLKESPERLEGVTVVGKTPPIKQKKDTLEYNVASFKTIEGATVEDLLKVLPGIQVSADGTIKVKGKDVDRLLVNGETFFSDDPKIATKNLPKDVVAKVQVTNTKTEEEAFIGDRGDDNAKTINLVIEEKKNGRYFGNSRAAYGSNYRNFTNLFLNRFNKKQRASILGGSNNVNREGGSLEDFSVNPGGASGQGIVTSSSGGASIANAKDDHKFGLNYLFSNNTSFNEEQINRANILPDRRFSTASKTRTTGNTNNHRVRTNFQYNINKTVQINVEPNMVARNSNTTNTTSTSSTNEMGATINSNEQSTLTKTNFRNFSNRFVLLKKLDTVGKFMRVSFRNSNIATLSKSDIAGQRTVFEEGAQATAFNQFTDADTNNDFYEVGARYRQSIAEGFFIDIGYDYQNGRLKSRRLFFDNTMPSASKFPAFDKTLSSDFIFKDRRHVPYLRLQKSGEKLDINVTARQNWTEINNIDVLQETQFAEKYSNVLLSAAINYRANEDNNLGLSYTSGLTIPDIAQLRPVSNLDDPLNVLIGNPNLNPTVNHEVVLNYETYNYDNLSNLFIEGSLTVVEDAVTEVTATDENFLTSTTYVNVDGNYAVNGNLGYSKEIERDSTFVLFFDINSNLTFSNDKRFVNGQSLVAKTLDINPNFSTTFLLNDLFSIELAYNFLYTTTDFSLDASENIEFNTQNASLRTELLWPKNIVWRNNLTYTFNSDVGPGFNRDAYFWNMSLGLKILKGKGTVNVLAFDVLNQNINSRRTTGTSFIQDFQGTVLQQFFMLGFSYNFNNF